MNTLKINHVMGINNALSYYVHTGVNSGGHVLLHIEGLLAFEFSKALVKHILDLKISGAFGGTIKIMHVIAMTPKHIQYNLDMMLGTTPILVIDIGLGISGEKGIEVKSVVNMPFGILSNVAATITPSLIDLKAKVRFEF